MAYPQLAFPPLSNMHLEAQLKTVIFIYGRHPPPLERQTSGAGELVTWQKCQGYFNLIRGDMRGIDIFSWKTSRVCVRIIWLGPSVCDEYFGDIMK